MLRNISFICLLFVSAVLAKHGAVNIRSFASKKHFSPNSHGEEFGKGVTRLQAGATLVASPAVIEDGQDVTVTWSGITNSKPSDIIAVYCPMGDDVSDYLDSIQIGQGAGATGSVVFENLINMRCDYGFRYLQTTPGHLLCDTSLDQCLAHHGASGCQNVYCGSQCQYSSHPIYGTDLFTSSSSICRAAVHAGVISPAGGPVQVRSAPGQPHYAGSVRHGVSSDAHGKWSSSFSVHRAPAQPAFSNVRFTNIAVSNPVTLRLGPKQPLHGHIALTGKLTEMRVMFTSGSTSTPVVKYGLAPGVYTWTATGTTKTYTNDMLCHAPANTTNQQWFRDPGMLHDVLLTQLQANTRYYYIFGSADDQMWSEEASFRTAKAPDASTGVRFIAYGDMGVDAPPRAETTMQRVALEGDYTDFLLHFGDISYALGTAYTWDKFFHVIAPVASRIPYMASIGNHEYDYVMGGEHDPSGAGPNGFHPSWGNYGMDSHGECSVPMFYRFHMPDNGRHLYWYSFDYGNVHVVQMSSEHDYFPGSPQYTWMQQDLSAVNRSLTPFVVITGHRPMYNSENCTDDPSASDFPVSLGMQRAFEDLLYKYRVDLALWGHQHSYERTCAVYQQRCNVDGTVHITVGTAGAGLEDGAFNLGNYKEYSLKHWVNWGYLRVATDAKSMRIQLLSNDHGSIVDDVTLPNRFV